MKPFLFALALFGLFPVTAFADGDPSWSAPREPYRIIDNVWYVGTQGIGVYLVTTNKGHFLIDGATEDGADVVAANIEKLGFNLRDVRYIVETHAHFDHVGGLAKLKALTGAEVVASAADKPALESGRHVGDNENGTASFPAVKVDRIIGEGGTVTLSDTTLMAHMTPGHTVGATSWTMTAIDNGKPVRVLFFGSTTVAGNVLVGNQTYPHIVRDYRISFDRLATLSVDVFLANHPFFADLDAKHEQQKAIRYTEDKAQPFIDPQAFPTFLAASKAAFEDELARQETRVQLDILSVASEVTP